MQIYKVREYVRKRKYLTESEIEKNHVSLDGETSLSVDLVYFNTMAVNNICDYVKARATNTGSVIKPVYVTKDEFVQANSIDNITINELIVKIFEILELLDDETSRMQEEVFQKNVRTKKKRCTY